MRTPIAGDVYTREDGAQVRVDMVDNEQVYYVVWCPRWETGNPLRKPHAAFLDALERERMVLQ